MTPHAFLLVPLGLALLIFSREWLYRLFIASTLFSGTAVFNVGGGDNASGVQVWMFFGGLWLLRDLGSRLARGNVSFCRPLLVSAAWLAFFLLIVTMSLVMPSYINGHLQIESPLLTDATRTPLFFSSRNITSWLYIVFGSLVAVSVAQENRTIEKLEETARVYLISGVFVALWGFVQLGCGFVNVTYPAALFNNSASPAAAGGFATALPDIAFKRMSSVSLEPSILSQVLLTVIPLTIPAVLGCGYLFSRRFDRACFLLLAAALIATTSSSAYIGVLVLILATAGLAVRMRIKDGRAMLKMAGWVGIGIPACFVLLYESVPIFRTIMDFALFSKATSYSALERLKTVQDAWGYFLQYPVLGVGWGSVTSHDLVFKLLANIGLLGLFSFAALVLSISSELFRSVRSRRDDVALTQMVWLLSFTMLLFMNAISEFSFVLGHMWLILGIAMGCATLPERSERPRLASLQTAGTSELFGA